MHPLYSHVCIYFSQEPARKSVAAFTVYNLSLSSPPLASTDRSIGRVRSFLAWCLSCKEVFGSLKRISESWQSC